MNRYIIKNPKFFKSAIYMISNMVDEGIIRMGKTVQMYGRGPSGIVVFDFVMGESFLEGDNTEHYDVGVNFADFQKITKRIKPDTLELSFNKNQQKITLKSINGDKVKTFRISAIDVDFMDFNIQKLYSLPFSVIIKMTVEEFVAILKDCILYSEEFEILLTKPNIITIKTVGQVGDYSYKFKLDSDILEEAELRYGISIIYKILKEVKGMEMSLLLGTYPNGPLPFFVYFKVSEDTSLKFFVAPRVVEYE